MQYTSSCNKYSLYIIIIEQLKSRYICVFHCSRTFLGAWGLKVHEDIHLGIYPYKCPYCGKGFSSQTNLRGHLVRHTGVREVPPLQPRVHILTHVAETPKTVPQLTRQILTINRNIPSDASTKTLLVILLKHFPKLV